MPNRPTRQSCTIQGMSNERWGDGNVYLRGKIYWIYYSISGKMIRESAKCKDPNTARKLLRQRLNQIDRGEFTGSKISSMTVAELLEDLVKNYARAGKSVAWAKIVQKHLLKTFQYAKAARVGTDKIEEYIQKRNLDGVLPATINRELSLLRRSFYLGTKTEPPKVARVPKIEKLKEGEARKGFFDITMLEKLTAELPPEVAAIARFAYWTGCRKNEILNLRWIWVDLPGETVALPPEITKSREGRIVPLVPEVCDLLKSLKRERDEYWPSSPWVFNRAGDQIKDFYTSWRAACARAGLPDGTKYLHDMRRSAVRNMVRSGISERVAMAISGHKTRSVFERYNIVSGSDLKDAAKKLHDFGKLSQKASQSETKGG